MFWIIYFNVVELVIVAFLNAKQILNVLYVIYLINVIGI